ncbi:hypothetical protein LEP1GSC195_0626 [Leptospira wolbachii serovar Codice str. CDC]|uniref:Uncharacterized protein n=1 Tax=Leptospira wolbachii serovar Codice str. CDC TaxID=1218599 RepID=R9A8T9_9LEPT|nr:hypothetical protein [Leptospira wolbachii]EOQ98532.1 hypothetical protein LEP1GSC195_0626 [Leptospira wolbachii serovar Codice str. CDC]
MVNELLLIDILGKSEKSLSDFSFIACYVAKENNNFLRVFTQARSTADKFFATRVKGFY